MSYINSVSASSSTYSVNRKLDIKSGIIELNKIKIRVNAGDSLQRICNKINSKTSLHFVTAKLARERGHTVISLSSSKQIDILDRNNILNNIGMRIRANLARNSLVDGLILTFLAEHKKASPRYIVQPYQINNLPAVSAIREEVNEFEGLAGLFNEAADGSVNNSSVLDSDHIINDSFVSEQEQIGDEGNNVDPLFDLRSTDLQIPVIQEMIRNNENNHLEEAKEDAIIQVKSKQPIKKLKALHKKGANSFDEYKELKGAQKIEFFKNVKDFLREKAVSLQDEKAPKYTIEMITKTKSAADLFYMYDKASPVKNNKRNWKY